MNIACTLALLFVAVLTPEKKWFAPEQPLTVQVGGEGTIRLVLSDFLGRVVEPAASPIVEAGQTINLRDRYAFQALLPGAYILRALPAGTDNVERFVGTPLVLTLRRDPRPLSPAGPIALTLEPLQYFRIKTERGEMVGGFYYDTAPQTVANFMSLARGGFYNGLGFHRVLPGVLVQTGDPRGDLTGGPGYSIEAEFSDRPHVSGVLSMARLVDPIEQQNAMPRSEFANSAGSQFFICLDDEKTRELDRRYTAFGRIVTGVESARAIGALPIADPESNRPATIIKVQAIEILPVDADNNPYARLFQSAEESAPALPSTQPSIE